DREKCRDRSFLRRQKVGAERAYGQETAQHRILGSTHQDDRDQRHQKRHANRRPRETGHAPRELVGNLRSFETSTLRPPTMVLMPTHGNVMTNLSRPTPINVTIQTTIKNANNFLPGFSSRPAMKNPNKRLMTILSP